MANMKTIALVSGGVVVAFGTIIAMNIGASSETEASFEGGITAQRLSRQVPQANADPFQVIADENEAARRATSNRILADEAISAAQGALPSYTAPPVIHMEGSSGDSSDPMASALVSLEVAPPELLEQPAIEPVVAPKRDYKVQDREVVAETPAVTTAPTEATTAPVDPIDLELLRRALTPGRTYGVSIQSYTEGREAGRAPLVIQQFDGSDASGAMGNGGLPAFRAPEPAEPQQPSATAEAEAEVSAPQSWIAQPEPNREPEPAGGGVLRSIDPAAPFSYTEGALQDAMGFDRFAALSREHDGAYDWRKSYQVAQAAIGIDNNSRIYDTSRNAMAFDAGALVLPGDQRYATLMYGFNSDDAAQLPVFAQLHDYGPASSAFLNGARVQGNLRLSEESAVMEFDRLILQDGRVIPITAMGISADQLRVGVFKNVNRHTLSRYSSLLVSGLIKGVGDVGSQIIENRYANNSGTTIIIGDGASAGDKNDGTFTDADRAAIAMGALRPIGNELAAASRTGFDRKPTVTAPAGFGFSIVFLDGLTFGQVQ